MKGKQGKANGDRVHGHVLEYVVAVRKLRDARVIPVLPVVGLLECRP